MPKRRLVSRACLLILLVVFGGCTSEVSEGETAEARAQAALTGQWQTVNFPSIPIAAALLPNGKVVTWSSDDLYTWGQSAQQTYTALFDPATLVAEPVLVTNTSHDMFCPGTSMLADGRVFVNGGGSVVRNTSLYSGTTAAWASDALMNQPRWYNSSVTLPNGDVFTLGGNLYGGLMYDGRGERWSSGQGWNLVPGAVLDPLLTTDTNNRSQEHPRMFVAPNGKLFIPGPTPNMQWYDLTGSGSIQAAGTRGNDTFSQNDTTVMFDQGKLLKAGGNVNYDRTNADQSPSSATAYVIDINSDTAQVHQVPSMVRGRAYCNGVVLPTGQVLVVGGLDNGKAFTDVGAVLTPELFDPVTETWSDVSPMSTARTYHSVALLMPDGRVFAGGGGQCGEGCAANHFDAEIFSPAYLFQEGRPAITSAPSGANYASQITVGATGTISQFAWIRMSAVTHSINTDQRRLPAPFTAVDATHYSVSVPANANLAPPGYYMLFALNGGVPSVAAIIQIGANVATSPPPNPSVCSTVDEDGTATLTCPTGQVINSVDFASYGTPNGACGGFTKGSCDAAGSGQVVTTACLGRATCSVPAANATFGDPCSGTIKRLSAQVSCAPGVPPPTASAVCASVAENGSAALSCPSGQVISSIDFASYGSPVGACGSFTKSGCNATTSAQVVSSACLGKASCVVPAANSTFGDPCSGTIKRLDVQVSCATSVPTPPASSQCISIDEGATATLSCGDGQVISAISFVGYGTPTGTCSGTLGKGNCDAAGATQVVSSACLGRSSCMVSASNARFGDPCVGTIKKLAAQVQCAASVPTSPTASACGTAAEDGIVNLSCPTGQVVTSIDFASYGTPSGACGAFAQGACNSTTSAQVVGTACLGQGSCAIPANNATFGEPCFGTVKRLDVQASCGTSTGTALPVCAIAAENDNATLTCPSGKTISSIDFASYGSPKGVCQSFGKGNCDASTTLTKVTSACVGKTSCSVPATNANFGDPCSGTIKSLDVQATCN